MIHSISRPKRACALVAAISALVLSANVRTTTAAAEGARTVPARVLQADESVARFIVDVAAPVFTPSANGFEKIGITGFNTTGKPGEPPALSRRYLVVLPPSGAYSVSTRIVATQAYGAHRLEPIATPILIPGIDELQPDIGERIDWDPAKYQAWSPPNVVEHDEPVYIRHQRVLPIGVNPVFYDAASNEVVVATQIEVQVRFAGGSDRSRRTPVGDRDTRWADTFARMFVNPRQAAEWQVPKPELAPTAGTVRTAPGAVKLRVRETGIHKVAASTLVAAGFPAGQSVDNVRLYRRTYNETTLTGAEVDIPVYVRESAGGIAGIFDGSDLAIFYGLRLHDDATQGDEREAYASANTYWLEPGDGMDMATRTPSPGIVSADTAAAFFQASQHFETDTYFHDRTAPHQLDAYFYASPRVPGPVDMPFTITALRPGGALALNAEIHGWNYEPVIRTVRLSLVNAKGEFLLAANHAVSNKVRTTFTAPSIPEANLSVGQNTFRMARGTSSGTNVDALLNFVTVSYPSLYRARGNALRFNTATLSGDTSVTVTGLSSTTDFELFDISNPGVPSRLVISPSHFTPVASGFAFSFRENIPSQRTFILTPVSRMVDIAASDVVSDTPSAIIGDPVENGVDVLVVSHASFISQMQQWAGYRRAQGYRVLMVDVADVFDEFNGGVEHARAIQRLARHFFERGNATALVLVGDASEDQKHIYDDSGPNLVPTFSYSDDVDFNPIDEVITSDKRFVKMPGPGGFVDPYPDMIVGRLPVGSTTELAIVLAKTFDYESPDASEFWRKRMIIVADDEYSEGGTGVGTLSQYCFNSEGGFQTGQENVAQIVENSLPAGYDVIRFYQKAYTSQFYPCTPPPGCPTCCSSGDCASRTAAIAFNRQTATQRLMDELNQGATMVTIQAHMNRSTVTHERLLSTEGSIIGTPNRDHLRVSNTGRPWIIFGLGCHFSDYTVFREQNSGFWESNQPNGDAFAEQLLFGNNKGAVATYGSSGYEFLTANNNYMNIVAQIWFYETPYDTMVNQTQAEWKLGELMFLAENRLAGDQIEPVERYHILGDPLLQIDAGPPSFAVNVNGHPVNSGEVVTSGGEGDTLRVQAVVTDENAIHKFQLEVAGQDQTNSLTIQPLTDPQLPHARQYQLSFVHKLQPENYDIVLRAFQSPDTTAGNYHMAAEFTLRVESSIEVSVNGRVITSGGSVPATGNYRVDLSFPVFVEGSEIAVLIDDTPVVPFTLTNPSPEDSLSWIITFRKTLSPGQHELRITAGPSIEFTYQLVVSNEAGLAEVLNYPNPMGKDGTNFMYSIESEITDGAIDIYTSSGKRVRRLEIPSAARLPGSNAVFWDGRDGAGDKLANGTYLYVIKVTQRGGSATVRGKLAMVQ